MWYSNCYPLSLVTIKEVILQLKYNLYPGQEVRGQMYNKLFNLLDVFYDSPRFSLKSITIGISYKDGTNRKYLHMLTTPIQSEDDIRGVVYFIEESCRSKGINFDSVDRIFLRVTIVKDRV